ncbi:NUDIX hydrolase [Streptococcus pluranimalium]|uniref:NUDIX hydrolase n=1 Tax=Streptococcus pluranimalium TaxID=82348 RepID=UPI003BF7C30C
MTYLSHFGVYGICIKDGQLLCVRKNRGPYKGRYDLPGGSQEPGESLLETLERELKEETGFELKVSSHNRIFDTFVKAKGEQETVHHIFAVYDIEINDVPIQKLASHLETGEMNDSKGFEWVDLDQLTPQNASPLILKLLDPHLKASYFLDWEILSEG